MILSAAPPQSAVQPPPTHAPMCDNEYDYTPLKHCLVMIDETVKTWERFLAAAETPEEKVRAEASLQVAKSLNKWIKKYDRKVKKGTTK